MRRQLLSFAVLAFTALAAGCGSGTDRLDTESVQLKIMHQDQPATGAVVALVPEPRSMADMYDLRPSGTVGEDGSVVLSTYEQGDGAPAGEYSVTVQWVDESIRNNPEALAAITKSPERFNGKYATREGSPWTVTIVEGDNTLETIIIP